MGRTKSMVSTGEEEQVRRCRRRHDNADIDYSSSSSPVNILHVCINPELPRAFHSLRQLTRPRDESLSPPPPFDFYLIFLSTYPIFRPSLLTDKTTFVLYVSIFFFFREGRDSLRYAGKMKSVICEPNDLSTPIDISRRAGNAGEEHIDLSVLKIHLFASHVQVTIEFQFRLLLIE